MAGYQTTRPEKNFPQHIRTKPLDKQKKEIILKVAQEKAQVYINAGTLE